MIELSYALRSKPSWWTKYKDPAIRTKWKEEALQHEIRGGKLSEAEVDWVLDELEDFAKMRDDASLRDSHRLVILLRPGLRIRQAHS